MVPGFQAGMSAHLAATGCGPSRRHTLALPYFPSPLLFLLAFQFAGVITRWKSRKFIESSVACGMCHFPAWSERKDLKIRVIQVSFPQLWRIIKAQSSSDLGQTSFSLLPAAKKPP